MTNSVIKTGQPVILSVMRLQINGGFSNLLQSIVEWLSLFHFLKTTDIDDIA